MNYKEYFLNDNASGWKTTENKLFKNNLDLYNKIIVFSNDSINLNNLEFKEKVWHFINNIKDIPKCLECSKNLKFGKSLKIGYPKYCSINCSNKNIAHINKVKITNNLKYGGDVPMCSEDILNKSKNTCLDKYGVDNPMKLDSVKEIFKNGSLKKYGTEYPAQSKNTKIRVENKNKYDSINIIDNVNGNYLINCNLCNKVSEFNNNEINYRLRSSIPICKNCFPIKSNISYPEINITNIIKNMGIEVFNRNRTILNGKELDIYIPSHNLVIEYNGLYWHSEIYKNNNYHLNKTEECEKLGIQLIHIFEDEWLYKREIVKSRLKNILGLTENKIYGRKTIIKDVSSKESIEFLNKNHIQGNVGSLVKIGLYYNNELVSLMTFGSLRKNMGNNKEEDSYELLRFCNKLDTTVIGGADKLLKHFIKLYQPKKIISYADRRWSQGNLYEKLGFNFVHNSKPNYYYIVKDKREYRFKYRKDVLVREGYDKDKTEKQIMQERGINRIYDCGNKKYELS